MKIKETLNAIIKLTILKQKDTENWCKQGFKGFHPITKSWIMWNILIVEVQEERTLLIKSRDSWGILQTCLMRYRFK